MPDLHLERRYLKQGHTRIAGIDEAGRGAWAGPVVAAAVILPVTQRGLARQLQGVNDSKQLTAVQREAFFTLIQTVALAVGVGQAEAEEIDRVGIVPATKVAMQRAVAALAPQPHALLIDAVNLQALLPLPQTALNFGDSIALSIAAASIIAKVTRDRQLVALDAQYPGYGLAQHKGYGTAAHQAALQVLGPTSIHRYSYAPIAQLRLGLGR